MRLTGKNAFRFLGSGLALTVLWAMPIFAAQPDGEGAGGDQATVAKASGMDFTVQPKRVYRRSSLRFDEAGNIRDRENHFRLYLQVRFEDGVHPIYFREPTVTALRINNGKRVTVDGASEEGNRDYIETDEREAGHFDTHLRLQSVPVSAWRIERLVGHLEVFCGSPGKRKALLSPVGELEGRSIKIKGLGESVSVSLRRYRRHERSYFRVELPGDAMQRVADITLYDRHGDQMKLADRDRGRDDGTSYWRFRGKMPAEGQVVLTFFEAIHTVEVPFTLTDLPLSDRRDDGQPPMVIEARPPRLVHVGPIEPSEPAKPKKASETQPAVQKPAFEEGRALEVEVGNQKPAAAEADSKNGE